MTTLNECTFMFLYAFIKNVVDFRLNSYNSKIILIGDIFV